MRRSPGASRTPASSGPCRLVRALRAAASDRGTVTAEFAVALPALVLVLTFALGAIDLMLDKVRCVDAARDAALATSRGGDGVTAGRARAPEGATVAVTTDGQLVRAVVTIRASPLGLHLGTFDISASSTALLEPGASP
jgi:Flp pilus assembly protein TadG